METIGHDLREMQRVPLQPSHIAAIRAAGTRTHYRKGAMLAEIGAPADRFVYVEDGEIEVVNPFTGDRLVPSTLGPTQFMSEISLLSGGTWSLPMRAASDTTVVEVPRSAMLRLMAAIPEMSDIVITVLAARRRRQLDSGDGMLVLVGEDEDRAVRKVAEFAARNRLPYRSYALGSAEAAHVASSCGTAPREPVVVFGRDVVVSDPTPEKVARLLGLDQDVPEDEAFDVLIVGAGPAGVSAGVYAGAEGLRALVVDETAIGGQAGTSSRIENYMGFPTGVSGADLVWRGEVQAMKFGTRFVMPRRIESLERLDDGAFCATFANGRRVLAASVVVATGVQYRRLPIARLAEFEGAGIYYAATENEARFCRDTEVLVIGGGNSAGQAAMFLSRTARHVRLLVRGDTLASSMSSYLSSRLEADPAITIEYGAHAVALHGGDSLEAVTIRNADGDRIVASCAVFVMVGAAPNTGWLSELVALDAKGFVLTSEAAGAVSPFATSCAGIYAVGDVRAGSVKRVASSVGEGSVVISNVWEHVRNLDRS
ncbi:cyclic nucleotide-binding domain-containing protein [Sphingomonas ginsenosidivorax]|uniref:Thioredoxin reductase n=1 Tax=Sphingomonas ginsenosidivorax TaxID=862135 RepID=A0A5C6UCA8_9SPHN|nr:cyclic nucleotide-binding domain-containing thioredoxin-disulfide reductase [Sphingomonas ginsenosidivorax]TXC70342.1 cyclic nucleotide-binding domain-containing protein [Sphingomonas ginsenosidivorax]